MTDRTHQGPAFNENRQVSLFYEPFSDLGREIDDVFSNFGRGGWLFNRPPGSFVSTLNPSADIVENDDVFEISVELPGIEQKDISLSLKDNILTLKGEKKQEVKRKDKDYHMVERSYGSFERSFRLPLNVDQDNIHADFSNGVMVMTIPKTDQIPPEHRKIEITTH
ncbi:MAG: Hsp20/alpha crystallin family protein [Alphaproteobacteria bacterium]|nr:Hsp20/alpha crystallin family protein [Alphaproteobacteria bacterium]